MSGLKKYWYLILTGIIAVLFAFLHFWKLADTLSVWNVDEIGMGYDALALKNYGTDRYLNSYPLYLTNYGGGQSVLYAYICAIVLHFIEFGKLAIRLPAFICVCISGIYAFRLMHLLDGKKSVKALLTLVLMAITPVYVMLFRIGMDCNLMLAFTPVFFFYFIKAVQEEKTSDYIKAGVSGAIILYTYALSYVVMVLFLIGMLCILVWTKKAKWKNILAFTIAFALLAWPLVVIQLINMFDLPEITLGALTFTKLPSYRAGEISFGNLRPYTIKLCLQSLFYTDYNSYNSVREYGVLYFISVPFWFIGFISYVKSGVMSLWKRVWNPKLVFCLWFALIAGINCLLYTNVNRMNGIYFCSIVFITEGIIWFVHRFKDNKVKLGIGLAIGICYGISAVSFFDFYFMGEYSDKYEPMSYCAYSLEEPLKYVEQLEGKNETTKVYIGDILEGYMYYAAAKNITPEEFFFDKGSLRADYRSTYQNFCFYLPEQIDEQGIYIVDQRNREYVSALQQNGFCVQTVDEYEVCYK